MATVVVVFSGVAERSSTPVLAAVITASVRNGMISDTAPTKVVLPTPKPPPIMILTDISVGPASDLAKSTENPFKEPAVRLFVCGVGLVQPQQPLVGHVGDQYPGHPERQPQQRRDLRHRTPLPAKADDRPVLRGERGDVMRRVRHRRDDGLDRHVGSGPGPAARHRVRAYPEIRVPPFHHPWLRSHGCGPPTRPAATPVPDPGP